MFAEMGKTACSKIRVRWRESGGGELEIQAGNVKVVKEDVVSPTK